MPWSAHPANTMRKTRTEKRAIGTGGATAKGCGRCIAQPKSQPARRGYPWRILGRGRWSSNRLCQHERDHCAVTQPPTKGVAKADLLQSCSTWRAIFLVERLCCKGDGAFRRPAEPSRSRRRYRKSKRLFDSVCFSRKITKIVSSAQLCRVPRQPGTWPIGQRGRRFPDWAVYGASPKIDRIWEKLIASHSML